jgi:hypothetical protein
VKKIGLIVEPHFKIELMQLHASFKAISWYLRLWFWVCLSSIAAILRNIDPEKTQWETIYKLVDLSQHASFFKWLLNGFKSSRLYEHITKLTISIPVNLMPITTKFHFKLDAPALDAQLLTFPGIEPPVTKNPLFISVQDLVGRALQRNHGLELARARASHRPPVPRPIIENVQENPLSKQLRAFDNVNMTTGDELGVYINTNECGVAELCEAMTQIKAKPNGCHIGFSGWHNFDIMTQRKSARGIICDINPENALFIHYVLNVVRQSSSRDDFMEKMIAFVQSIPSLISYVRNPGPIHPLAFQVNVSEDPLYRAYRDEVTRSTADDTIAQIKTELKRPTSWLFTEERFQFIKALAENDLIVTLTEDICATKTFFDIVSLLRRNGQHIDSLYVSNIVDGLRGQAVSLCIETIKAILHGGDAILIYSDKSLEQHLLTADNASNLETIFSHNSPGFFA